MVVCADELVCESVRVFARDWSKNVSVMPHHIARSTLVDIPRMNASIPRVLEETETLDCLADALSPGDVILAPAILPQEHDGWSRFSHDSLFMVLDTEEAAFAGSHDLRLEPQSADRYFESWRTIPDIGPVVDTAVLSSAEPPLGQFLIAAFREQVLVGTMRITIGAGLGGMSLLAVPPSARRTGVARRLVAYGLTLAFREGCRKVHFQVDGHNERAIRLYTQMGARVVTSYRYLQRR